MIELTPAAHTLLHDYLGELQRALAASSSVDSQEVERDVRDHIDLALADKSPPVDTDVLNEVLRTLGPPDQWLSDEKIGTKQSQDLTSLSPQFRKGVQKLGRKMMIGLEGFQLPYLSLFVLTSGWLIAVLDPEGDIWIAGIIGTICSFVLARSALALIGEQRLSNAQRWLLYPGLFSFYVPFAVLMIVGPPVVASAYGLKILDQHTFEQKVRGWNRTYLSNPQGQLLSRSHRLGYAEFMNDVARLLEIPERDEIDDQEFPRFFGIRFTPVNQVASATTLTGAYWIVLFGCSALFPHLRRWLFAPFVKHRYSWTTVIGLMLGIALLTAGGQVLLHHSQH